MDRVKPISDYSIGIVGVGVVGGALLRCFEATLRNTIASYDKFLHQGSLENVNRADIVFVCVPTPWEEGVGCDLSCVEDAVSSITGGKIVVIKSTVIPGTTEHLQQDFPHHTFIFSPEFLTQATADQDIRYPDRQTVGFTRKPDSYAAAGLVMQLLPLAPFERIIPATEAEMVKYFCNAWFSTKVAFANQMFDLCEMAHIDYELVKECAAADKRIGRSHLEIWHNGYRGFRGGCLPKDLASLIDCGDSNGVNLSILKAVKSYNDMLQNNMLQVEEPRALTFKRSDDRV